MEYRHLAPTLEEIRETRPILRNAVKEAKMSLSPLEKFALFITRHVGTMGFFIIVTVWSLGWLLWNVLAPVASRFDPAPAFVFWLFI